MKMFVKIALILLLSLSTAWAVQNAVKRSSYVDETYGFSIDAPRFPGAGPKTSGTALILTGPPVNGVAPNINVTIQGITTTLEAYRDLSNGQFQQLGLKVNSQKELKVSGREAIQFDYEGSFQPGARPLRFLSLAVIEKERVVLVTCTTTPEGFPAMAAEFQASIDSLKFP